MGVETRGGWALVPGEFLPTLRTRQHRGKLSEQFGQREKDVNELESFAHTKLCQYTTEIVSIQNPKFLINTCKRVIVFYQKKYSRGGGISKKSIQK